MKNICLISKDLLFKEDFSQQISKFLPETAILDENNIENSNLVLIDEDEKILKEISKKHRELPIIFLSSEVESSSYADSVVKKPFVLLNFLISLKNKTILPKVRQKECMNMDGYTLYPVKKEIVSVTNKTIKLTEKEVDILKYLYQNNNKIVNKEEMLENVWGYSSEATTHTVETHIYRLRQKIEQEGGIQLIFTENGGYRINI